MTSTPPSETFGVLLRDHHKKFYNAMRKAQEEGRPLFLMGRRRAPRKVSAGVDVMKGHSPTIIFVEHDLNDPQ